MPSRIAVVAIDAVQPHLIAGFWCSVLGWQVVEEDAEVISIAPSDGAWPTIDVLAVSEPKTVKNRFSRSSPASNRVPCTITFGDA